MVKIKTGNDLKKFREKYNLTRSAVSVIFSIPEKTIQATETKHPTRKVSALEYKQYNNESLQAYARTNKLSFWEKVLIMFGI